MYTDWVVPSPPTRYTAPRDPPAPYDSHPTTAPRGPLEHAHMVVLGRPKEILGVRYAQVYRSGLLVMAAAALLAPASRHDRPGLA